MEEQREEEKMIHEWNLEQCGDDEQCIEDEYARHEARMEEIAMEMRECKRPCHEQGQGSGGQ